MCVNGEKIHPPVQLIVHFNKKYLLSCLSSCYCIAILISKEEEREKIAPFPFQGVNCNIYVVKETN